jgi:hypothetical protein
MATQYTIDDAKKLFNDRAGTRGISSNVTPDKFNRWFNSAELKFFNERYSEYAKTQIISDSISKWMTDPLYLPVSSTGVFPFFPGMSLLHVDSMSAYMVTPGTMIATLVTTPGIISSLGSTGAGSGYTPGVYVRALSGGNGTGASATITVGAGGTVTGAVILAPGSGYTIGDTLTAGLPGGGSGFNTHVVTVTFNPGVSYTPGSYYLPLTGGTGTGATAFIVVNAAGNVQTVLPSQQGNGYTVGDTLSATIPSGSGFVINVVSLTGATADCPVTRVEKRLISANLSSTYDAPSQQFPIYTQFSNSFQFYPKSIGFAKTVILQQPNWSFWGYTLNGYIGTLTGLVGGSAYTNGTYTNVPLTGGVGNSALATIVVAGAVVTSVTITNPGKVYLTGDVLSAAAANIGGTGSGFQITVSSLVAGSIRPVYSSALSVQPLWNNDDISTIIDLALQDASIASRDKELASFANQTSKELQ